MPFEPGQSGNPSGRQVNKDWAAAIKRALARKGEGDYHAGLNLLADRILDKAIDGDMAALKEVGDRLDGKAAQAVTLANEDGQAFKLDTIHRVIVDPKDRDTKSLQAAPGSGQI